MNGEGEAGDEEIEEGNMGMIEGKKDMGMCNSVERVSRADVELQRQQLTKL